MTERVRSTPGVREIACLGPICDGMGSPLSSGRRGPCAPRKRASGVGGHVQLLGIRRAKAVSSRRGIDCERSNRGQQRARGSNFWRAESAIRTGRRREIRPGRAPWSVSLATRDCRPDYDGTADVYRPARGGDVTRSHRRIAHERRPGGRRDSSSRSQWRHSAAPCSGSSASPSVSARSPHAYGAFGHRVGHRRRWPVGSG